MGVGQSKFYLAQTRFEGARAELPKPFLRHLYRIIDRRRLEHDIRNKCALLRRFQQTIQMIASGPRVLLEFGEKTVQQRARRMVGIDPLVVNHMAERLAELFEVKQEEEQVVFRGLVVAGRDAT